MKSSGIEPCRLLEAHGIDGDALRDPYAPVLLSSYVAAMETAAAWLSDPLLGAKLGQNIGPELLGPIGVLFTSADTVREAFDRMSRFIVTWQGSTLVQVRSDGPVTHVIYQLASAAIWPRRQDTEFSLVALSTLLRMRLGADWDPRGYAFEHEELGLKNRFHHLTGAPACYGQKGNWLLIDTADLDRLLPQKVDPAILLQRHLEEVLDEAGSRTTFADEVRRHISERMGRDRLAIQDIAHVMRLSPRTLQRRLAEAGTGFRDLVATARSNRAGNLMGSAGVPAEEIAAQLGYSDTTVLSRARRRWAGKL